MNLALNSKSQIPNLKEAPSPKLQIPTGPQIGLPRLEIAERSLKFGFWILFGGWNLDFGFFLNAA